jgi:KipI family sensor histidine kinase inhibitor
MALTVTVAPLGDAALRVTVEGTTDAAVLASVADAVRAAALPSVIDVVAGMTSVLVTFDPGDPRSAGIGAACGRAASAPAGAGSGGAPAPAAMRVHEIEVWFDGPDLAAVAGTARTSERSVADLLCGSELTVRVVGFSPGFGYLEGLPAPLASVPRRDDPRPLVPAGALALAGGFAAVYPRASPGGWQIVGSTDAVLFDPDRPPHAVLAPGDRVRFRPAARARPPAPARRARQTLAPPAGHAPGFVVCRAGPLSTVQDRGRRGVAHLGVPAAGAADPDAHELANALVGNDQGAPVLEVAAGGLELEALRPAHVAVVGGASVSLDGLAVAGGRVLPVGRGQHLGLHPGERPDAVVAVAGGFSVDPVFASVSTDLLTGLGPGPLAEGDVLGTGEPAGRLRDHLAPLSWPPEAPGDGVAWLRVLPGPHPEWFGPDALASLGRASFTVGDRSNRVGVRLEPDGGPVAVLPGELASTGMVAGAVQVPPNGHPVVLGVDHATLGGYPVLAVVVRADLGVLGRCRPGDRVRFAVVDEAAAAAALRRRRAVLDAMVVGRYPVASA